MWWRAIECMAEFLQAAVAPTLEVTMSNPRIVCPAEMQRTGVPVMGARLVATHQSMRGVIKTHINRLLMWNEINHLLTRNEPRVSIATSHSTSCRRRGTGATRKRRSAGAAAMAACRCDDARQCVRSACD
jgi:hypothetical protein